MKSQKKLSIHPYLWMILIMLVGFGLRVYRLADISVNRNETYDHARWISQSFRHILIDDLVPGHPFIWAVDRAALLLLGDTIFVLRWPSLAISMIGIAALYALVRRLFNTHVGLISAFLLAISPYAVFYAHRLRGYSTVIALPIVVYLLAYIALRTGRWRYWLLFSLAAVAMIFTHLFTLFALINVVLALGLIWWFHERDRRPLKQLLFQLGASLVLVGGLTLALYSPLWFKAAQAAIEPEASASEVVLRESRPGTFGSPWNNLLEFNGLEDGTLRIPGAYLFLGLGMLGLVFSRRFTSTVPVLIMLVLGLFPFLEVWAIRQLFVANFWAKPEYLSYTLAPLLVLVALGLAGFATYGWQKKPAIFATTALAAVLGVMWLLTMGEFYQHHANGNWQAIGDYLRDRAGPTDLVVCQEFTPDWAELQSQDFCTRTLNYRRKADINEVLAVVNTEDLTRNILPTMDSTTLTRQGRVWVVVWNVPPSVDLSKLAHLNISEFDRFGRSFVFLADQQDTYLANTYQALTELDEITVDARQDFLYKLMNAMLATASGNEVVGKQLLQAAAGQQPDHPQSGERYALAEQIITDLAGTSIQHPITANFGDKIMLQGYTLSDTTISPGSTLDLTFFWRALGGIQENYKVFIHLKDQSGNLVAQFDYEPFYGNYPTGHWQPGQNLVDANQTVISNQVPPGQYQLVLGLYNPNTLERLPLQDDQSGENALLLTPLTIQ